MQQVYLERSRAENLLRFELELVFSVLPRRPAAGFVKECDLIICWRHNWRECPLEVLALKSLLPNCRTARRAICQRLKNLAIQNLEAF